MPAVNSRIQRAEQIGVDVSKPCSGHPAKPLQRGRGGKINLEPRQVDRSDSDSLRDIESDKTVHPLCVLDQSRKIGAFGRNGRDPVDHRQGDITVPRIHKLVVRDIKGTGSRRHRLEFETDPQCEFDQEKVKAWETILRHQHRLPDEE